MNLRKNRRGETESVFKLALVIVIIAAVLAVVAYLMGSAWGGTTEITGGMDTAAATVGTSADCLVTGSCDNVGPGS